MTTKTQAVIERLAQRGKIKRLKDNPQNHIKDLCLEIL